MDPIDFTTQHSTSDALPNVGSPNGSMEQRAQVDFRRQLLERQTALGQGRLRNSPTLGRLGERQDHPINPQTHAQQVSAPQDSPISSGKNPCTDGYAGQQNAPLSPPTPGRLSGSQGRPQDSPIFGHHVEKQRGRRNPPTLERQGGRRRHPGNLPHHGGTAKLRGQPLNSLVPGCLPTVAANGRERVLLEEQREGQKVRSRSPAEKSSAATKPDARRSVPWTFRQDRSPDEERVPGAMNGLRSRSRSVPHQTLLSAAPLKSTHRISGSGFAGSEHPLGSTSACSRLDAPSSGVPSSNAHVWKTATHSQSPSGDPQHTLPHNTSSNDVAKGLPLGLSLQHESVDLRTPSFGRDVNNADVNNAQHDCAAHDDGLAPQRIACPNNARSRSPDSVTRLPPSIVPHDESQPRVRTSLCARRSRGSHASPDPLKQVVYRVVSDKRSDEGRASPGELQPRPHHNSSAGRTSQGSAVTQDKSRTTKHRTSFAERTSQGFVSPSESRTTAHRTSFAGRTSQSFASPSKSRTPHRTSSAERANQGFVSPGGSQARTHRRSSAGRTNDSFVTQDKSQPKTHRRSSAGKTNDGFAAQDESQPRTHRRSSAEKTNEDFAMQDESQSKTRHTTSAGRTNEGFVPRGESRPRVRTSLCARRSSGGYASPDPSKQIVYRFFSAERSDEGCASSGASHPIRHDNSSAEGANKGFVTQGESQPRTRHTSSDGRANEDFLTQDKSHPRTHRRSSAQKSNEGRASQGEAQARKHHTSSAGRTNESRASQGEAQARKHHTSSAGRTNESHASQGESQSRTPRRSSAQKTNEGRASQGESQPASHHSSSAGRLNTGRVSPDGVRASLHHSSSLERPKTGRVSLSQSGPQVRNSSSVEKTVMSAAQADEAVSPMLLSADKNEEQRRTRERVKRVAVDPQELLSNDQRADMEALTEQKQKKKERKRDRKRRKKNGIKKMRSIPVIEAPQIKDVAEDYIPTSVWRRMLHQANIDKIQKSTFREVNAMADRFVVGILHSLNAVMWLKQLDTVTSDDIQYVLSDVHNFEPDATMI